MIEVYPVKIEAVRDREPLFRLKTFDEYTAILAMETTIAPSELDELFTAIRRGMELLELLDMNAKPEQSDE